MTDDARGFTELDPATEAVRDLIGASRELVGRTARLMQMNANDMSAIGALVQYGPMGASELAEHLGIRSASATVMIDRLERAGHVERVRDTVDRRRITVTETDAARRASFDAWSPTVGEINDLCTSLTAEQRSVVVDVLHRVIDVIGRGARE